MASIAAARAAAASVLFQVERGLAHSDDALRTPAIDALARRDRDLTTELVLGTLRWEQVLDDELASLLTQPDAEMHLAVIVALRLGAYQLLFLDRIPPHAAIGESVELAKQADGPGAASLTNAVLRRLARQRTPGYKPSFSPEDAQPKWLLRRWQARFGAEATQTLCAFYQAPPPVTLRLLTPEAEGELLSTGVSLAPGEFLASARRVLAGDAQAAGKLSCARFQDEASQLVGELGGLYAGAAQAPVLDACAAPGGKTAILLERTTEQAVVALEISQRRLRAMKHRLQHPRLTLVAGDASTLAPEPTYGTILADVPCSGTGTLARNPEIRSRLRQADLPVQAQRQQAILTAALRALRPGGTLVYSTCSLEAEENEQVVEGALHAHSEASLLPAADALDQLAARGIVPARGHHRLRATALSGPFLRTVPGILACDGFFAAILRKQG